MPLVGYKAAGGGLTPRTYYLEDDWGDNALSSRSNADAGAWFYQPVPSQPGDTLVGRYRPAWSVESGSPSATNQELQLPNGSTTTQAVATNLEIEVGSWSFDWSFATTPSGGGSWITLLSPSRARLPNGCYYQNSTGAGSYNLLRRSGGSSTTLISSTWPQDTANYSTEVTRDDSANWEMFLNGTSKGTATDTNSETGSYSAYYNEADARRDIDNLQVQ